MDDKARFSWLTKSTLTPALLSSVLCWLAFPPVGWGLLVWVAPIGWLVPVAHDVMPGKRPYRTLWFAGLVFWLLTLHWIRLPHPMNYLGWPILCGYLAVYLPLFVALARVGVHRLRLPLWLVAPVVWTGLDWVRGHFMTGFLMGSLAHTQVEAPWVIQLAAIFGEYGVTSMIVLVAACLTQFLVQEKRYSWLTLAPAAIALVSTQLFVPVERSMGSPGPRIALIQGNTLADWKSDPEKQHRIMAEYARLTEEAIQQSRQQDGRDIDLVIWPETAYRNPLFTLAEGYQPPVDLYPDSSLEAGIIFLRDFVKQMGAAILTGVDRVHLQADDAGELEYEQFNSSVLINKQGELVGTYDKMHLVIMGEYVPFTRWLPFLKRLTPMTGLAIPGESATALTVDDVTYCPNICYETCVPHLIRRQVRALAESGTPANVLVNLTNDAWFWGSSELDMHLACGVFRAVEMRLPLLIAANGGLTAYVDAFGTVRQVAPRQEAAFLLVDLQKPDTTGLTFYARHGDSFAIACAVCCLGLANTSWRRKSV